MQKSQKSQSNVQERNMAPGASEFERMTMLPAGAKASTAIADRRHAAAATATVRIFASCKPKTRNINVNFGSQFVQSSEFVWKIPFDSAALAWP